MLNDVFPRRGSCIVWYVDGCVGENSCMWSGWYGVVFARCVCAIFEVMFVGDINEVDIVRAGA